MKQVSSIKPSALFLGLCIWVCQAHTHVGGQPQNADLNTVGKKLINPVSDIWSLVTQHDSTLIDDDNDPFTDKEWIHSLKFQPVMPIELTDRLSFPFTEDEGIRLIARPVFPLLQSNPEVESPSPGGGFNASQETGFGDIQMATILAPSKKGADGLFWGVGASWRFPTASDSDLGSEKWAVGPAAVAFNFKDPWILGIFPQHQWSYAGDGDRDHINQTNIQYFILRDVPFGKDWKVGTTSNITIDWSADDSDDRLNLPIGLGATTVRKIFGKPTRLLFEVQAYPFSQDSATPLVNFRILVSPALLKPEWANRPIF